MLKLTRAVLAAVLAPLMVVSALVGVASPASATSAIETMPLWRLQVRVTTGDTDTAGTNGNPAFRFNSTLAGVRTLNPPSITAFDRGRVDTYDLRLLDSPSQITMLRVGIAGNDDWCVKRVELLFNGRVAFAEELKPATWWRLRHDQGGALTLSFLLRYSAQQRCLERVRQSASAPQRHQHGTALTIATSVTGSAMLSSPDSNQVEPRCAVDGDAPQYHRARSLFRDRGHRPERDRVAVRDHGHLRRKAFRGTRREAARGQSPNPVVLLPRIR